MTSRPLISLPTWAEAMGLFSRKDKQNVTDAVKVTKEADEQESLYNLTHMPKNSLYSTYKSSNTKFIVDEEAEKRTLTILGVEPNQMELVEAFFHEKGLYPKFEVENDTGLRGNWIYAIFDEPIETIKAITPIIKIAPDVCVACSIGTYHAASLKSVPDRDKTNTKPKLRVFRSRQLEDDLTTAPHEEKSFIVKIREYILGQSHVKAHPLKT